MWGIWVLCSVSEVSELVKVWWPKFKFQIVEGIYVRVFRFLISLRVLSQSLSLRYWEIHVLDMRSMNSLRAWVPNIVSEVFGDVSSGCEMAEHCRVCVLRLESEVSRVCVWNVRPLNSLRICVLKSECVAFGGLCWGCEVSKFFVGLYSKFWIRGIWGSVFREWETF